MMNTREKTLKTAHTLVVKVGSAVLTTADGLHLSVLYNLVEQLARLSRQGRRVCLVSSGAVAAGRTALPDRGRSVVGLSGKQALAAIGQGCLMREYEHAFASQGLLCAQVLLTRDDLRSRTRFLNARNTFMNLLDWGVVPIVNENDTVAVQELKFGDNDQLASLLLNLVEGDLYINLTSADGVLAVNPEKAVPGAVVPCLDSIEDIASLDIESLCGAKTSVGTGGMRSKLMAARRASQLGVPTLILPGRRPDILDRAFAGEHVGTWVCPAEQAVSRRKYWMAYQSEPQGTVVVDEGAARALEEKGGSLLPGGVTAVEGSFEPGALVRVVCGEHHIGVGLTNYSSEELERIKGLRRVEVAAVLGDAHYPEVIHRDNLLINAAV
ncbi:glutamate 5-kinase [uncultured Mailhella sp.]|uniref:glutamate 5-kinase n=1 Tax=uncultured Mailhella sp. TaxID=1981031 RepID=UPI0025EF0248|nr:glutamate 5-kinase [uncultured Mailhella sp.]